MNAPIGDLGLALLGTIAALSLLQGLMLLGAALYAFRAVRRTEGIAGRLAGAVQPSVVELAHAARDAAEVSELVLAQAYRVGALITDTIDSVERAQEAVQRLLPAAGRVAAAATAWRLLRSGVKVLRRFRR
jgi:hypothetical protein